MAVSRTRTPTARASALHVYSLLLECCSHIDSPGLASAVRARPNRAKPHCQQCTVLGLIQPASPLTASWCMRGLGASGSPPPNPCPSSCNAVVLCCVTMCAAATGACCCCVCVCCGSDHEARHTKVDGAEQQIGQGGELLLAPLPCYRMGTCSCEVERKPAPAKFLTRTQVMMLLTGPSHEQLPRPGFLQSS